MSHNGLRGRDSLDTADPFGLHCLNEDVRVMAEASVTLVIMPRQQQLIAATEDIPNGGLTPYLLYSAMVACLSSPFPFV